MAGCRYRFGVLALALGLIPSAVLAQTRVACVGDSITYGYGLSNREQEAYPAVLAELLGADFEVGNYGDSGSTLYDAGDKPWRAQAVYSECLAFAPDVVVIMLGTNDAKPANWSEAGFVADYQALIGEFRDRGASVIVATPPPVVPPGAFDIPPDVVNQTLVPLVRQIALDEAATLVDVYAALEGKPELLPDTVHPNAAGAQVIAETVADAILASDDATATTTQTAASTTNSSTAGAGAATGSGSGGLTSSSAGPITGGDGGEGGVSSQTSASSSGSSLGSTSAGPVTSAQPSSSQASSSQTSSSQTSSSQASSAQATLTSNSTGGVPATNTSEASGEGCACNLGAVGSSTSSAWFWSLVLLVPLIRRRAQPLL